MIGQRDPGNVLEQDIEDPRGAFLATQESAKQDLTVTYSDSSRFENSLQVQREMNIYQLVCHLKFTPVQLSARRFHR